MKDPDELKLCKKHLTPRYLCGCRGCHLPLTEEGRAVLTARHAARRKPIGRTKPVTMPPRGDDSATDMPLLPIPRSPKGTKVPTKREKRVEPKMPKRRGRPPNGPDEVLLSALRQAGRAILEGRMNVTKAILNYRVPKGAKPVERCVRIFMQGRRVILCHAVIDSLPKLLGMAVCTASIKEPQPSLLRSHDDVWRKGALQKMRRWRVGLS